MTYANPTLYRLRCATRSVICTIFCLLLGGCAADDPTANTRAPGGNDEGYYAEVLDLTGRELKTGLQESDFQETLEAC
jgi:hypothetical protein